MAVRASTSNVTSVDDSATVQTILSANGNRLGFWLVNDSDSTLYLNFGGTATTSLWTMKLLASERLEHVPSEHNGFIYTGSVSGIWSAGSTGGARVTEFE